MCLVSWHLRIGILEEVVQFGTFQGRKNVLINFQNLIIRSLPLPLVEAHGSFYNFFLPDGEMMMFLLLFNSKILLISSSVQQS